jgi:tetratricopeptide (TPR) repeat protein
MDDRDVERAVRVAVLVALVALLAFAPTLRFGLAYDDEEQIAGNPSLRLIENIPRAFGEAVWAFLGGTTNYYRPLQIVAYTLIYQGWGVSPMPYHILNVLLYAASAALVALFATRVLGSREAGACAGLLFALHPAHAETVAWNAALPDLLVGFFALVAALLYARGTRSALAGSVFATAGGFLSKEVGLVIPLLLAAQERVRAHGAVGDAEGPSARRRLPRWAPHAALVPAYIAARFAALGGAAPASEWSYGAVSTALALFARIGNDALRLLLPFGFSAFTQFRPPASPLDPPVLAGVAVTVAVALLARRTFRARSPLFVPIAWLAIPLLPTLYLPGIAGTVLQADRYLYLPSVGFALLAAAALAGGPHALLARRDPLAGRAFAIGGRTVSRGALAAALVLAAYAAATPSLLAPWRDSMTLYDAVLARDPEFPLMRLRRAVASLRAGDLVRARADYAAAIEADSSFADAWLNLGAFEIQVGRFAEARSALDRARDLYAASGRSRGLADALANLGELARARGDVAAAESLYLAAIHANPEHMFARNNLGALYAGTIGRPDLALRELEAAARAGPWYVEAKENLAGVYASQGRWHDAARVLREIARIEPRSVPALVRLGFALEKSDRPDEARGVYARALRLDPANAAAAARLATLPTAGR